MSLYAIRFASSAGTSLRRAIDFIEGWTFESVASDYFNYCDCFNAFVFLNTSVYVSLSPGIARFGFGGNYPTVALEKCVFP